MFAQLLLPLALVREKNKTPKADLRGTSLVPFEEIFVRGFSEK